MTNSIHYFILFSIIFLYVRSISTDLEEEHRLLLTSGYHSDEFIRKLEIYSNSTNGCSNSFSFTISKSDLDTLSAIDFRSSGNENGLIFVRKMFWTDDDAHWYGEAHSGGGAMNILLKSEKNKKKIRTIGSVTLGHIIYSWVTLPSGEIKLSVNDSSSLPPETMPIVNGSNRQLLRHRTQNKPYKVGRTNWGHKNTEIYYEDEGNIDIMCIYTREAACNEAGIGSWCDIEKNHREIDDKCELAVSETNTAFELSGVKTRLRLVYSGHVDPSYNENNEDFCQNMIDMAKGSNPSFNNIKHLQEKYKADLVGLIVDSNKYCGCSYQYNGKQENGYFMVSRYCMNGNFSFGHEIGHTLGADHSLEAEYNKKKSVKSYAHGYHDPLGKFRTIMAYHCPNSIYCPRVQRYSSPNGKYFHQGGPLPFGSSFQNNSRKINESYRTVANFKKSSERDRRTLTPDKVNCSSNEALFELDLHTDFHPEDTSWKLVEKSTGKLVVKSEKYEKNDTDYFRDGNSCITVGKCYKLIVNDRSGDGLKMYGNYKVYINGKLVVKNTFFKKRKLHKLGIDSSSGSFFIQGRRKTCSWILMFSWRQRMYCSLQRIRKTCPVTCNSC